MSETTFTFHVDAALMQAFGKAAKARNQTEAQLLSDCMREIVRQQKDAEYQGWFQHQVQAGLDSANEGRLIAAEEVEARFAARRAATRRKLADKS